MHRIDTDGAVDGKFQDGNPAIGQQGTIVDDAWHNAIQEAVAQTIEYAGGVLVKGDNTQLWKAIAAIASGILGVGGESGVGAVPTTRQVLGGGLVTGGGALDGDRTLTVTKASAADILAGASDTAAITPLGLKTAAGTVLGATGQIIHPGGLIEKWGTVAGNFAEGQQAVNFAAAFPNACDNVQLTIINSTASSQRDMWPQLVSKTAAGFVAYLNFVTTGGVATNDGFMWVARGH